MIGILSLRKAVRHFVHDGDSAAFEGFTHLIPTAAGHELIRRGRRGLMLICMTPDLVYDLPIGAGCAKRLVLSRGGNPGVGSLRRLCDAMEEDWPQPLEIKEHSHADLANAYIAGASGLPFAVLCAYADSGLSKVNPLIRSVTCPFTGEVLAAVFSVRPDASVIHAQKADRKGNVPLWGIFGVQKETALMAKRCIVIVEEIVDELNAPINACVLPGWAFSAVCLVPDGVHPSYAHGYYERDDCFYQDWDSIARDRESSTAWIDEYIRGTEDSGAFRAKLVEGR